MNGPIHPVGSSYSKSLIYFLLILDLISFTLTCNLTEIKWDSTVFISLLLWIIASGIIKNYSENVYTKATNIVQNHFLIFTTFLIVNGLISLTTSSYQLLEPTYLYTLFAFGGINLMFKIALYFVYFYLRHKSPHNKRYLIIGKGEQGYSLRMFLRKQHGNIYQYVGTLDEPDCEADIQNIDHYCKANAVQVIYYIGNDKNPYTSSLYQLANRAYMYFHYVINNEFDSHDFGWSWINEHPTFAMLTYSSRKAKKWKRKSVNKKRLKVFLTS